MKLPLAKRLATLDVIPFSHMRYATVGDWWLKGEGEFDITVAAMGDADSEFLVALHELVEAYLCRKAGITDEEVTAFDKAFEAKRQPGNTDEPGDESDAPYRQQHRTATLVEMIVADAAGVDWKQHEKTVNAL